MTASTYAGKTFEFTVDNGVIYHNTYAPDGTRLHFRTVAGPAAVEDVDLHAAEVAPGVFIVGWVEKSGLTVTHAMNLNIGVVHAFWTYETESGRVGELHTGHLKEL